MEVVSVEVTRDRLTPRPAQAQVLCRYAALEPRKARPDVLAAQRKESARIRSEK